MLESLLAWDREALVYLSMSGYHTPFLNFLMWMTSQTLIWAPALLTFLYVVIKSKKRESFLIIGMIILLILVCDQLSSSIIKPLVARPRPGFDPLVKDMLEYVNNYRGGRFGYLSSHATNTFGFAVFTSLLFRYRWYSAVVFLWAAGCSYTRIYLGVHFPLDIISGMLLGMVMGGSIYYLYTKMRCFFFPHNLTTKEILIGNYTPSGFLKNDIHVIIYSLGIIFFSIVCCAGQAGNFLRYLSK